MKIIIIGAGISGLSTYLFLRKYLDNFEEHHIRIYEAYDTDLNSHRQISKSQLDTFYSTCNTQRPSPDTEASHSFLALGAGLGLGENGLNVLKHYSQDLHDKTVKAGAPVSHWTMSNQRGWTLGKVPVTQDSESRAVGNIMIRRHSLWLCLREEFEEAGGVVERQSIASVVPRTSSGKCIVTFKDGSLAEEADLIVGADGLRSIVRKAIFTTSPTVEPQGSYQKDHQYIEPHYEGLVGVGGFVSSYLLEEGGAISGEMTIIFGANGFFGCGNVTSNSTEQTEANSEMTAWWSTYPSPSVPDWKDPAAIEHAKSQLKERHKHWKNPVVHKIIEEARVDSVWPTFTTPLLPRWSRDGLVLIGDAAHCLQPSSGQGASQALEDAEAFALLLARSVSRRAESTHSVPEDSTDAQGEIDLASGAYERMRMPRIARIHEQAKRQGDMKREKGGIEEYIMYGFLWLILKFGFGFKSFNEDLFGYDLHAEVNAAMKKEVENARTTK